MKRQNFKRTVSFFLATVLLLAALSTVGAAAVSAASSTFLAYPDSNNYWLVYYDPEYEFTVLATGYVADPEQYDGISLYFDGLPEGVTPVPVENVTYYCREGNGWTVLSNYAMPADAPRNAIASSVNIYDSARCLYRKACTYEAFVEGCRLVENDPDAGYRTLVGEYKGAYSAPQGITGVTLSVFETAALLGDTAALAELAEVATRCGLDASGTPGQVFTAAQIADAVRASHSGDYVAFFNFYPTHANLNVEEGLYMMSVTYNGAGDSFALIGEAWICRDTYMMADLQSLRVGNGAIYADLYANDASAYGKVGELQAQIGGGLELGENGDLVGGNDEDGLFEERYFAGSAFYYNHDLARLTLCLETDAFTAGSDENWGEGKAYDASAVTAVLNDLVRERCANLIASYNSMGFDTQHYYNYDVTLNDTSDKVAFSIATKKEVCGATLVAVVIRGGNYGGEWSSNFNVKEGALYHTGFYIAAMGVYEQVMREIATVEGDLKFWVTGFSRGAAVANILSAKLNDHALESEQYTNEDVYAYTFATPQGVTTDAGADDPYYGNIFNIVNPGDIVPQVAPAEWGYTRYGVTRTFSATTYESDTVNAAVFENVDAYLAFMGDQRIDARKNFDQQAFGRAIMDVLCETFPTAAEAEGFLRFVQEVMQLFNTKQQDGKGNWESADIGEWRALLEAKYGANPHWQARVKAIEDWNAAPSSAVKTALSTLLGKDDTLTILTLAELNGADARQVLDLLNAINTAAGGLPDLIGDGGSLLKGHELALYLAWLMQPEYQVFGRGYLPPTVAVTVACPVDVTVYDGDLVVAAVMNHQLIGSELPAVLKGDAVTFYFPSTSVADYRIVITPTDSGSMNYTVTELDVAGNVVGRANYYDIALEIGQSYAAEVDGLAAFTPEKYDLTRTDSEGETVITAGEVSETGEQVTLDVTVTGEGSVFGAGSYQRGDVAQLTAYPAGNATFVGWYSEGALLSTAPTYTLTLMEHTALEAVFAAGEGYLVALVAGNGSGDAKALGGVAEGDMALPACPFTAPVGMQFKGWALSAAGEVITAETVRIGEDTVLYALWEQAPDNTPAEGPEEEPPTEGTENDPAEDSDKDNSQNTDTAPATDAESAVTAGWIVMIAVIGAVIVAAAVALVLILKRRR